MSTTYLDFESPLSALDEKLAALQTEGGSNAKQIEKLRQNAKGQLEKIYNNLTIWQKVQVARHPARPHTTDYINMLFEDFDEFHGDRHFGDDNAIVGGIGLFEGRTVMAIGHDKGHDTDEKILRNFGMPHPEGLRKAGRLMQLAERFGIPVVTFVDTAGAYPGVEGEERGQAEAIAYNLALMSRLAVPMVSVVIGEGGSGGALAIGVGDRVAMLRHSIYSVATPEACASIIWRDAGKAQQAAEAMRVNSEALHEFGLIDDIIEEPIGGAHRDHKATAGNIAEYIQKNLDEFCSKDIDVLVKERYDRIINFGRLSLKSD